MLSSRLLFDLEAAIVLIETLQLFLGCKKLVLNSKSHYLC